MEQTIEQLRETIAAKRAYGVKTTRLENELYRLESSAMPAYRRHLQDVATSVLIAVVALILWVLQLFPIMVTVARWFNS
jgi:cell shape-determining protein MreC